MRRRPGSLLPLEIDLLGACARQDPTGPGLHGYALAQLIADANGSSRLTGHGTLYKALARLAESGLVEDTWEDPDAALAEGRPRRRLYRITGLGQRALAEAVTGEPAPASSPRIAQA